MEKCEFWNFNPHHERGEILTKNFYQNVISCIGTTWERLNKLEKLNKLSVNLRDILKSYRFSTHASESVSYHACFQSKHLEIT